jgi:hypothetical protein
LSTENCPETVEVGCKNCHNASENTQYRAFVLAGTVTEYKIGLKNIFVLIVESEWKPSGCIGP